MECVCCRQHVGAVFEAEGLLASLGDLLQQCREKEVRARLVSVGRGDDGGWRYSGADVAHRQCISA